MSRCRQDENVVDARLVPPWSWVSYVGSVAGVLRSRRLSCDFTDVAGMSGYAFVVNVHEKLCPSGPTGFDWTMLEEGTQALGIETEILTVEHDKTTNHEELVSDLFERVRQEIDAGRCCVVWGATSAPEFGIVYGYRASSYLVRSFRSLDPGVERQQGKPLGPDESPEEPVQYDKLTAPGCLGAVFFGDTIETDRFRAEWQAVARGAQLLRARHSCFDPDYAHGVGAFTVWAESFEAGRAEPFGNTYNTHCYWEMQLLASEFCKRLGKRHRRCGKELDDAARQFGRSAGNLERLKQMFPLPGGGDISNRKNASEAAELLRQCKELNERAAGSLEKALGLV